MKSSIFLTAALFTLLFSLSLSSCKKDKDNATTPDGYSAITMADIKAKESLMATTQIVVSNSSGVLWKSGYIYMFKNKQGRYGKFMVNSIDISQNYQLDITAAVYNADGSVKAQKSNLIIRGTYLGDLDNLVETNQATSADFYYIRASQTDTVFDPTINNNGAKFVKF